MPVTINSADNYDLEGNTGASGDAGSHWPGGQLTVAMGGTFNSSTIQIQANVDGVGFANAGSFTSGGVASVTLSECKLRFAVTSGTPTSVLATVIPVRNQSI